MVGGVGVGKVGVGGGGVGRVKVGGGVRGVGRVIKPP